MKVVVKIGGQALEERRVRKDLARQLAGLRRRGHTLVVVHGGGKLLTQTLARLGIATEFHAGLRLTDGATRDVALMVLAGLVNKQWVAALEAAGQPALGICGGDASLIVARKISAGMSPNQAGGRDLGFVGRPHRVNAAVLDWAAERGLVPVVASLGLSPRGEYLNINADDLAAALAVAIRADRLLFLTEAGGVLDARQNLLPVVRVSEISSLIREGIVTDGMIPKLRSSARTLRQGVREIDILSAAGPAALLSAIEHRNGGGTRIVK